MTTEDRLNKLAGTSARRKTLTPEQDRAHREKLVRNAAGSNREGRALAQRRVDAQGRFKLGDVVRWCGATHEHRGEVVEVVKHGRYPGQHWRLKVHGYCRDTESYVVRSGIAHHWPHACRLELVQPEGEP